VNRERSITWKKVVVVESYIEFLKKPDYSHEKTQEKIAGFWAETVNQSFHITKVFRTFLSGCNYIVNINVDTIQ
jgi:hypothetical protein